jgi:hypothetical protein
VKVARAALLVFLAGFVAAPIPGDDLGSCSESSLARADPAQHCRDRFRALCGQANRCGIPFGDECNEAAVAAACDTAFWPEECAVAERDALHCIELLQELECNELSNPVNQTNVDFCVFCPLPEAS